MKIIESGNEDILDGDDEVEEDDEDISFGDDSATDLLGLESPMNMRKENKTVVQIKKEDNHFSNETVSDDGDEYSDDDKELFVNEDVQEAPPTPEPEEIEVMEEIVDEGGNALDVEESYEDDAMEFITDSRTIKRGGIVNA